jgi:hypothetical protein
MQTIAWVADSDPVHFSDKFSYKILFILSYRLKDMDLARLTPLQQFSENRENGGTFLTGREPARVAVQWGQRMLTYRLRNKRPKRVVLSMPHRECELRFCWTHKGSDHCVTRTVVIGVVSQTLYTEEDVV